MRCVFLYYLVWDADTMSVGLSDVKLSSVVVY